MALYRDNYTSDHARHGININLKSGIAAQFGGSNPSTDGPFKDAFPCNEPVNPKFSDVQERLKTFATWPFTYIIEPILLAAAGLFYLGDRDRCKCFYCNGGLQHWELGDDPMVEHAKYFPQCEFVLQHKGPDFVSELNSKFPFIKRPGVANHQKPINHTQQLPPLQASNNLPMQQYQPQPKVANERMKHNDSTPTISNTTEQELIVVARNFGFSEDSIKLLINRKLVSNEPAYTSVTDLVSDLIELERKEEKRSTETKMDTCAPDHCNPFNHVVNQIPLDSQASSSQYHSNPKPALKSGFVQGNTDSPLKKQLREVMDESMCRSCFAQERSCAFMSCGHLCCCFECGQQMKRCPICNGNIVQAIKIYKI